MIASCSDDETDHGGDSSSSSSSFDSLPNDVVADILLRLPAQFLHSSAIYVNRTWAEISQNPSFINSHLLHHSHRGFLIQDSQSPFRVQSICASELELKETNLHSEFRGKIRGSSDGVLLINKSGSDVMELYVANPVTMQVLKLPTLPSNCRLCSHCNNIARISSTGEIKVISLGKDSNNGMYNWYVITLGKEMSWRKITTSSSVPEECDPASYLSYVQSLSVEGVVYWTNSSWITDQSVLAIDLGDESVHHLKAPRECHGQYWTLVQMGREICCMNCGKNVELKVWKLKDLVKKEWILVKSIWFSDETVPFGRNYFCVPLVWVGLEVLVLSVYVEARNVVVAYHVRKGAYKVIKIDDVSHHAIFQHTQSLIRF